MDKYEFNIKVEQIKKLVNRGDYATAMKICDTIDWRRVRNGSLLSMVSQIYEKNEEYQEAKEVLRIAYERAPVGKRILYKLTDLALREGRVGEAETYYREFCEVAQDDPRQYLLRYLILKEKKAPIEQLIRSLEAYTSSELDEKWMYELAELYHKAGLEDKCVATCDTIMLMFGLGKYVDKAMDLKLEYAPLNKYQMDLVENRDKYEAKLRAVEEEYSTKSYAKVEEDTVLEEETPEPEVSAEEPTEEDVIRIHEDEESEKLAQEMAKIAEEPTAIVEEDEMEATRTLDDLHSLKEIKPTQRVLDAAAEREAEAAVEAEREIERQRAAIRAAKEREEMEAEALRRAEEEREKARREEEERRAKREAEIARERALREEAERLEQERLEREKEKAAVAEEIEIESLDDEPEMNNLMIEAETEEEGLAMAIEALKKIHRELGYKNPVAKISSEKLNKKGIRAVADKLAGKDLVIEHAAGLTAAVQNELDDLMEKDKSGMIVVLIDTPENLENLHATHASLASKFQYIGSDAKAEEQDITEAAVEEALEKEIAAQEKIAKEAEKTAKIEKTPIVVKEEPKEEPAYEEEPADESTYESTYEEEDSEHNETEDYDDDIEMDADEFAQFACKYASEIDCSITGKSMLALYERIEMMEEDGVRLTQKAAVDLIEEAADKAEKKTLRRKLTSIFSPAYDKDGFLILREKDFFD